MTLSVIIATKNRASTLRETLETIQRQTLPVDEIVIVDQSSNTNTRDLAAEFSRDSSSGPELIYLYDPSLSGAGAARNVGIECAHGDLFIFLDDDVLLETDFFEQLVAAYMLRPELGGVQGIITNYSRPRFRGRLLEEVFFLGPFRDERMPIYWNAEQLRHDAPIPVRKFTSCLMSVKRSALGKDRFDGDYNGRGEDIDLSWRISERHAIAIAPAARARHLRTLLSRSPENWLTSTLTGYYYLHYRIWNTSAVNRLCFLWLKCGFAAIALGSSLRNRSIRPWRAFLAATRQARDAGYLKMRREYT